MAGLSAPLLDTSESRSASGGSKGQRAMDQDRTNVPEILKDCLLLLILPAHSA